MDKYLILPAIPESLDAAENFRFADGADFWRLHIDDGVYCENCVCSSAQDEPQIETVGNATVLTYSSLRADDGKVYDVTFKVHIETEGDKKRYYADIDNHAEGLRVNEIQLPFFDFDRIACAREDEVLYIPCSLGERIPNFRQYVMKKYHTEYSAADDKDVWASFDYGGDLTMSFYGVQSADAFVYMACKDPDFSITAACIGTQPRNCDQTLRLTFSQYPLVTAGECVTTAPVDAAIFKGDWRKGAEDYRAWADTWEPIPVKPQWVKEMTGWQRLIMKAQYGEIYFKYKDIPRLWEDGARYGITTILLFGWWKGCFDNGYPVYEPDDEMGGAEELKKAIKEVNDKGGHVLLYANGRLVDRKSDYYQQCGQDVCQLDMDHHEYVERYRFSNRGTMIRKYGHVSFAMACAATDSWSDKLCEISQIELDNGSNGCFFDQIGGALTNPCFNPAHKHGKRGAQEGIWRIRNFNRVLDMLNEDQALATENICDAFATRVHFLHGGCGGCWRTLTQYPYMFRAIFPEVIISNRFLHDNREDMRRHLNNAFVFGLVFDSSLARCRGKYMSENPLYSEYIQYLIDKKEEYHRFFYDGTFVSTQDYELPEGVWVAEYVYQDEKMFAFMNDNEKATGLARGILR